MPNMLSQNENIFANVSAERSKRSSNFSTKEVKYLIQLVDNKKDIIESKKTDRTTSEEKIKAWMEIEEEFNAVFEDYRTYKVLKTKYDNLKKNIKRKLSTNVSNLSLLKIMQSNDNAVTNEPLSDVDYDLSEDENTAFKSNASDVEMKPPPQLNEQELDAAAEEYVFETLLFDEAQACSSVEQQKTIAKATQIQQQPKPQPRVEKKKPTVDIWEQVAHKKLKKLDLEINVIEEEWNIRKHKLELEVENVKIENRFKEEKLKLEIELLKQKIQNSNNISS